MKKILIFLFLLNSLFVAAQTNGEIKSISKSALSNGAAIQIVNGQISVVDNQSEQKVRIYKSGSIQAIRRSLNFIEGANTTLTFADNPGSDWADITITSASGSSAWGAITGTLSNQTDLNSALNLKANIASPTFTGTVGGITASMVGLGNVENTAISTWAGSSNILTVGTIGTGTWNATTIADGKIASALTGKTYNGLTLTSNATGFSVAGGTTSKTLTLNNTLSFSGTDASTLNIGAGGTLGSHAFISSLAPSDITSVTTASIIGRNTAGTGVAEILSTSTVRSLLSISNVDNTSDANKPVSTAEQTALNLKANIASPTFTGTVSGITATMVGLGNVTNESKATMFSSPTFTGTVSGVTATHVGLGNVNNTNDANKPVSTAQQTALDLKLGDNTTFIGYQALGSPFLTETLGETIQVSNTSTAMVDGQIKFTAVYLPKAATITGIRLYVRVLGVYTGDNNNRVGLYSYSAGVLTLVASSANSAILWTSAANAFQTIAFSSTYAASAGIYFVGFLYNNSVQTTAPSLASGVALNNLTMATLGFTNSAKLYGTANGTDLTTPKNMSAITASVIPSWVALY